MKKRREKGAVLTHFKGSLMDDTGDRVMLKLEKEPMTKFLEEHEVYVPTSHGHLTRMRDETVIESIQFPEWARQLRRSADQIEGKRTISSLATEAQITRVKEFYGILAKREDNTLFDPGNLSSFTHGEIGQLYSDLEAVLVAKGLWDVEAKKPTEKAKQLKKKKSTELASLVLHSHWGSGE